jgi:arylsulfatase A-like enzyme
VSSLDFAPTFVTAAGGALAAQDKLDGVDLLPFLTGKKEGSPHDRLLWRFTISAAIRDGNWKLVRLPDRLPLLYDLSRDISEQQDVALDNLERTRAMLKQLGAWDVRLPHPVFLEGAVWKRRQLALYDREYPLTQP